MSVQSYFVYPRRVAFHETDAMGVLHHSNHVKIFEEARVAWLRDRKMIEIHAPYGPYIFAVTGLEARYFRPASFDDALEVWVQSRLEGMRIHFQYALLSTVRGSVLAEGRTTLVPIDTNFKPLRLPRALDELYLKEPWDLTWPPKLN